MSRHKLIRAFFPENQNIAVQHDDMGQGITPLHTNKNHLPVNGLYYWAPGKYGPIINMGESLWLLSKYKNPHLRNIDSMAIALIFWEEIN